MRDDMIRCPMPTTWHWCGGRTIRQSSVASARAWGTDINAYSESCFCTQSWNLDEAPSLLGAGMGPGPGHADCQVRPSSSLSRAGWRRLGTRNGRPGSAVWAISRVRGPAAEPIMLFPQWSG